jgi:hypothetical protein
MSTLGCEHCTLQSIAGSFTPHASRCFEVGDAVFREQRRASTMAYTQQALDESSYGPGASLHLFLTSQLASRCPSVKPYSVLWRSQRRCPRTATHRARVSLAST